MTTYGKPVVTDVRKRIECDHEGQEIVLKEFRDDVNWDADADQWCRYGTSYPTKDGGSRDMPNVVWVRVEAELRVPPIAKPDEGRIITATSGGCGCIEIAEGECAGDSQHVAEILDEEMAELRAMLRDVYRTEIPADFPVRTIGDAA